MSPAQSRRTRLARIGTLFLLLLCPGCQRQDRGPERAQVQGTAVFAGQPIQVGEIRFEPDTSQGGSGPQSYLVIEDGKFDSRTTGKGPTPGPQKVRIDGYTNASRDVQLFRSYETTIEIPPGASEYEFEIPEDLAMTR